MVSQAYVPARGDIIWLNFNPQTGREQAGKRPALVLSPEPYNRLTGLALVCPITSRMKGYPFEVKLESSKVQGVVLVDHLRSVDWKSRKAKRIESASDKIILEVAGKVNSLLPQLAQTRQS